jgi:hypothetical protein
MPIIDDEEWGGGWSIGDSKQLEPLELTDEEWEIEKERLRERIARKRPVGFTADGYATDTNAGRFPTVPRFDVVPRDRGDG